MKRTNYEKLAGLLTVLFRQLPFPMGGCNPEAESIYMVGGELRMTAIATHKEYVVVSGSGEVYKFSTVEEVESCFLIYFRKSFHAGQQLAKNLGMEF